MNESFSDGPPIIVIVLYLAFVVFLLASFWKLLVKAGRPGWQGIIPILNVYFMTKMVGKPGWYTILFLFVPFLNIWLYNLISKSFGKSEGFTVGLVLLPFIFFPILAFGDARYLGPSAKEAGGLTNGDLGSEVLDA